MTELEKEKEDNARLLSRAKDGDKDAKEQLVVQNSGLVWSIVHRFLDRGVEKDDLFQIGCVGLIKAIDRFDDTYNVQFSTYAVPMIMGEIRKFLRDDGPVKVSRSIKELAVRAYGARARLEGELGRSPTVSELAGALGVELDKLLIALESCAAPESLYESTGPDGDQLVIDTIQSVASKEDDIVSSLVLRRAIESLDKREQSIIIMRYFRHKTQMQVADMLSISQVQVSRIEKKLLKKLKEQMEA